MKKIYLFMLMMLMIPTTISFLMILNNSFFMFKLLLINSFSMSMSVDMLMDWISLLFLSTVIMISSLIIMFSVYYIPKKEHKQFMLLLLMFVLSMSILIISNNLFLVLLGWDGLGLSSYILVIYYQNYISAASGTITLLSNRIGDILILLSMAMLTLHSNWNLSLNLEYPLLVVMLLMIAACSKSAQFPFSAWLPMAMAAPTPISALVHSSTLVTAGVFLMLRMNSMVHPMTMTTMLIISSATAIYSSMSANWEQDMKKIIALSTLSQIAMMMFAISLSSLILAYIHLIIHALFKSAMFMCAGVMIHESSYQDMRMMGINSISSPLIMSSLGVTTMALMGIPFMSGFFSKDLIIENMMSSSLNLYLSVMMIMSIGMTTSYSIRMTLFSNKSLIKSTMMSNHQSINSNLPPLMLSVFAITSGNWLTWLLSCEQMFMLNSNIKMIIMTTLISGVMLSLLLQFNKKNYMNLGLSSISLWFTHFLSIISTNKLMPLMHTYHNNDKLWQENYGPKSSFTMSSYLSMVPESTKSSLLFTMILMLMIPMFMM